MGRPQNIKICRNCGGSKVQLLKHFIDKEFIGFRVECGICGFKTQDYKNKTEAISAWNNPGFIKEERK